MGLAIIIAAGGIGSRMGQSSSKQLMVLAGVPVLARSIGIFDPLDAVEEIVIAIDQKDILHCRMEVVDKYGFSKVKAVVPGGANRALSVKGALGMLGDGIDIVGIHDGARPLFPAPLLEAGLSELNDDAGLDGVVYAVPVTDTVKEAEAGSGLIAGTPDRSRLWAAQTPQLFRREMLEKAYSAKAADLEKATDDSYLVERAGGRVKLIAGSRENIKLTEPLDLVFAEEILKRRESGDE